MDRRTFIKTTGVAATAAPLVSGQKSNPSQIEHVVVVMMENRSFDHLFGWLPNADGLQAGLTFPNPAGGTSATFPLAPDYTSCSYPDPDHSYDGGRTEYDNGLMDGFLLDTANGLNAIGYYTQKDLPFRSALARNYTTCDRYFPSILAPTFPNRIFQHAGQTDRLDDSITISTLPTIWDNLAATGVSNKYYFGNVPFLALWGKKYLNICHPYSEFLSDCAAGTLPAVSFVDPSFTILSNLQNDDHPFSDVRNGDAFLAQAFAAVSKSPNWANTVFIINFPTLAVDANASRHPISPYVYGINDTPTAAWANIMRIPVRRFGGDATTSYNWQNRRQQLRVRLVFPKLAQYTRPPALPDGSSFDLFHEADLQTGALSLGTISLMDWTPKDTTSCSFSVAKYGAQTSVDPYNPDCGNGVLPTGSRSSTIRTMPTSRPAPTFEQQWVVSDAEVRPGKYRRRALWSMDNEPEWWYGVHIDIYQSGPPTTT
jgi:hypothetical protein